MIAECWLLNNWNTVSWIQKDRMIAECWLAKEWKHQWKTRGQINWWRLIGIELNKNLKNDRKCKTLLSIPKKYYTFKQVSLIYPILPCVFSKCIWHSVPKNLIETSHDLNFENWRKNGSRKNECLKQCKHRVPTDFWSLESRSFQGFLRSTTTFFKDIFYQIVSFTFGSKKSGPLTKLWKGHKNFFKKLVSY